MDAAAQTTLSGMAELFRANRDWQSALEYNPEGFTPTPVEGYAGSCAPFTFDDIEGVYAMSDGEADETDWLAVLRLGDGRFIFVQAGCDYAGGG